MKIKTSAPGKLMLMGEHAVVYGQPCLVTAVDHRMSVEIEKTETNFIEIDSPDVDLFGYKKDLSKIGIGEIPKAARFVEITIKNIFEKYKISSALKISTKSDFTSTFGFGSSSAVTVCTAKALSEIFDLNLSNQELFEICYKSVLEVQGKGSGFDLASAIWGGTILFKNKGEIIEQIEIPGFDLAVGYTGQKYETVKVLDEVKKLADEFPETISQTYKNIGKLVNQVVEFLKNPESSKINEKSKLEKLGKFMNLNQGYLELLGAGSKELYQIIFAARDSGSYGAKLSGAGKGDCAIALVDKNNKEKILKSIENQDFEIIRVKVGAEGVRVEE